jgi:TPR repeat protein
MLRLTTALLILGVSTQLGFGQNIEELKKKAEKGDVQAQLLLGGKLIDGEGIQKNEREGARWLAKAVEQNDKCAKYCYGVCLTYGIGVSKDLEKAVKLLDETVNPKAPKEVEAVWDAYIQLVDTDYFQSNDGSADARREKIFKWALLAAKNNIPRAQHLAAEMYHEGLGVPKDISKAAKLMRAAAKGGDISALSFADTYEYDAMNPLQRWMADKKKEKIALEKKKKIQDIQKKRKDSEVADLLREIRDQNAELLNLAKESSEQVSSQHQANYIYNDSSDQLSRDSQDSADEIRREINQAQMWDAMQSRLHSQ